MRAKRKNRQRRNNQTTGWKPALSFTSSNENFNAETPHTVTFRRANRVHINKVHISTKAFTIVDRPLVRTVWFGKSEASPAFGVITAYSNILPSADNHVPTK